MRLIAPSQRFRPSDEGFALVVALLTTAIAFVIMAAVLAQSIHNVVLAGYGRRRLAAVNAAEAGLNWYANLLSTSNVTAATRASLGWTIPASSCWDLGTPLASSCWYVLSPTNATAKARVTVANRPELATFELRVLLLTKDPCRSLTGEPTQCSLSNVTVRPTVWSAGKVISDGILKAEDTASSPFPDTAYAVVRATGTVGSVQRTLETYVRLRAIRTNVPGGFLSEAVCLDNASKLIVQGDMSLSDQAKALVDPALSVFDADCRTGDVEISSGDSLELRAFAGAGGTLAVRGGGVRVDGTRPVSIAKDIWAEGSVRLGTGSAATTCPANGQCVEGNVIGSAAVIGSNAYVAGSVIECAPACPPQLSFPSVVWDAAQWSGWTIQQPASSAGLLDAIETPTSPTVFHIVGSPCDVSFAKNLASDGEIVLRTQIAIVSECSFSFSGASAAVKAAAGVTGAALLLLSVEPVGGANCGSPAPNSLGTHDVEINQNPSITTGFFIYTPCFLWIGNNQNQGNSEAIQGQFAARYLVVDQTVTLTQVNIGDVVSSLPGQLSGFEQDVRFVREIAPSIAASNAIL